jgi:23S rRNA (cytidine1920-2'-O)/16S rRNA (cytidine1409-2'-O)-methyltransferase
MYRFRSTEESMRVCTSRLVEPMPPDEIKIERALRVRLDKLLVDRKLVPSRERAQAMILAGRVMVDEQKVQKSGNPTLSDAAIRLLGDDLKFVGRGGLKLEKALLHWGIDVAGKACADIGASTGGFTDCLLQAGAASVMAIDTGYGQIAEKLRADARVTLMERTNARLLEPQSLASAGITFFAVDVSFISATLVLPAVLAAFAAAGETWRGEVVMLIKPQFEAGREHVGKGGIVRTQEARQLAINRVAQSADSLGASEIQVIDSPIKGMEGNHEYLLHAYFGAGTA